MSREVDAQAGNRQPGQDQAPDHRGHQAAVSDKFAAVNAIEQGCVGVAFRREQRSSACVHDQPTVFASARSAKKHVHCGLIALELNHDLVDRCATTNGTLLAAYDARPTLDDLPGPIVIVMRRRR